MQFARPPDGFRLSLSRAVKRTVDETTQKYPHFQMEWEAICDRIKMTGHREGTRIIELERELSYIIAFDFPATPTVQIVYTIHADTLKIQSFRLKNSQP